MNVYILFGAMMIAIGLSLLYVVILMHKNLRHPDESPKVSTNEQAKESSDLEDHADIYYCRSCLAMFKEECCCEEDD